MRSAIAHGAWTRPPNGVKHADAPVADLVAEPLHHDGAIRGHHSGCLLLVAQERDEVARGALVEAVLARDGLGRVVAPASDDLARRAADPLSQLSRTPDALALPEWRDARHARCRRDEHLVARDVLDPPRRRPEDERLPLASLVDHLLVELADPPASVREEHAEQAAVGDRARIRDGEPPRARAAADDPLRAIPDDARPQLRELVRGIAAGEHVEHVLQLSTREALEGVRAAHELVELAHLDLLVCADRDDLLREDVERVARDARLLDLAFAHRLRDDGRLEQVAAELGEDAALRDRVQVVAGAADPLEPARNRLRALHLDH